MSKNIVKGKFGTKYTVHDVLDELEEALPEMQGIAVVWMDGDEYHIRASAMQLSELAYITKLLDAFTLTKLVELDD